MEYWEDWQKPYRFGTLVIWPPEGVRGIVNAQREQYDPVSQSICQAHITVTQPFSRPLEEDEWKQIKALISGFQSFEIHYGPLRSFLPYPCIWYEIQPVEKVLALRNALHETGFFNLQMEHPENFIPHMTITEGLSGPCVDQDLLRRLQNESDGGSFLCESISSIVPDEDFHFRVLSVLPLSERHPQ